MAGADETKEELREVVEFLRDPKRFKKLGANPMGDLLMATPALSNGVMYVRSATSLFAVKKK